MVVHWHQPHLEHTLPPTQSAVVSHDPPRFILTHNTMMIIVMIVMIMMMMIVMMVMMVMMMVMMMMMMIMIMMVQHCTWRV